MIDHFSLQAAEYANFRPTYPAGLFDWLASLVRHHDQAWDCATGSGQAAIGLREHFAHVIATDVSAAQLAQAFPHPGISYRQASAEDSGLPAASMDILTVAQAYHWFDQARFLREARRVLRTDGVLAVWGYHLLRIAPAIDSVITHFHAATLGPYWPAQRRHVEDGYSQLPFAGSRIAAPDFAMSAEWTLEHLCGYLRSWSATQRYMADHGRDPVATLRSQLAAQWPVADATCPVAVAWPLFIQASRMSE